MCSGNNPARRDERTTAKETAVKNSSNPRLWLHSCKRAVHDFVGPLLRLLTTWQLCSDTQDEFREKQRGKTRPRRSLNDLCPGRRDAGFLSVWDLWGSRSSDQKAAKHQPPRGFIPTQAYTSEQHRIPSWFFFLFQCGRSTMASGYGQDF